jgi:hypothetical protein
MKFNNLQDLIEFVTNSNLEEEDVEYTVSLLSEKIEQNQQLIKNVVLDLPSGNTKYTATVGEENVLFVEAMEIIPNSCGSGYFIFDGKKMTSNICDFEDKVKATISIIENGKPKDIEFSLRYINERTDGNSIIIKHDN